ncbi:MAG: purine-nucleoside phosphorylase [Eubacterium sp.]|nr:purine-nucleoside phosphorylase [Eubacterium sp.]
MTASEMKDKVEACVKAIRGKTDFVPDVALVLGSGLGAIADEIEAEAVVEYQDIPGFPVSTVSGHEGRFVFGKIGETKVVIMQGRVHYYEGYSMQDVVLPTRVMALLGAKILFLTNASGGINPEFDPGDLMLIRDQITMFVPSPLIGENVDEWGPRFPSMNEAYNVALSDTIAATAKELGIPLREGVYIQTTGPQYETPTEITMFRGLGADAVGMSTTVETIAANHMGMRVCGISCITNVAGGSAGKPVTHEEVKETADRSAANFKTLVKETIKKLK